MKKKLELEYVVNTSPKILYNRLSTPSGLSEWFADNVILRGNNFKFVWNGSEQEAELLNQKKAEFIRFRWLDEHEDTYFEFKIQQDELTGDVALLVTDFALQDELTDTTDLWDQQVSELKHSLGL